MANKCEHCGSTLLSNGLCPKCDVGEGQFVDGKSVPKLPPKDPVSIKDPSFKDKTIGANTVSAPSKRKKWPLIVAAILLALLLAAGILTALNYFGVLNMPLFNGLFASLDIPKHYGQHAVIYKPKAANVQKDDETGITYMNNIVLVYVNKGTSEAQVNELAKSLDGKVVGHVDPLGQYQIEIPEKGSLDELLNLCAELSEKDFVDKAMIDKVVVFGNNSIPNDPWEGAFTGVPETWDPSDPDGSNWWVEAVNAPGAWDYTDKVNHITVGIVDGGFDYTHPELQNKITYYSDVNDKDEHGTHVAGIIAAEADNNEGLAGIVRDCDLVTWDVFLNDDQKIDFLNRGLTWDTDSSIYGGLAELVDRGAKVINFSLGCTASMFGSSFPDDFVNQEGDSASYNMLRLLENGYDFLVVQSAGNGNALGISVDAKYNGLFCCINEYNCNTSDKVSYEDIVGRVIVVGAAQNMGGARFQQASFSNAGSRVDICAPGYAVFSSVPDGYEYMSGTSMATPVVTGIAALTWSANTSLSAPEVKSIICDSANTKYEVADNISAEHPLNNSYRMVDAQLCVEAALNGNINPPTNPPTDTPTEPPYDEPPTEPPYYEPPTEPPYVNPTEPPTTVPRETVPWSWGRIVNNGSCDIVIALDNSSSMKGEPIERTKEAAYAFAQNVIPRNTNVGIVTYNRDAETICELTANLEEIKAKVDSITTTGATNIEAGLTNAQRLLDSSTAERKIIVLMSDGVPNIGKVGDELVSYADGLKSGGTNIFTLGFFVDLTDSELTQAQYLMEKIAGTGCHYEIDNTGNLTDFFGDIADVINGQKYIYMRLSGPGEITVSYGSESLISDPTRRCTRTSYGTLGFEAKDSQQAKSINALGSGNEEVKVVRVKDGISYRVRIDGIDDGSINFSIGYMDEKGNYTDVRKFEEIPIKDGSRMDTVAGTGDKTTLKVDEDGDGYYDRYFEAGANETAKEINPPSDFNFLWIIAIGLIVLVILVAVGLIVFFIASGKKKKTVYRPYY